MNFNFVNEGIVNTTRNGEQDVARVAKSPVTGNYVIAWISNPSSAPTTGVYAQRYWANDTKRGGEIDLNLPVGNSFLGLAMDNDDNFYIASSSSSSVRWHSLDAGGNLIAQGNANTQSVIVTEVALDCHPVSGSFVVTWARFDGVTWIRELVARSFTKAGVAITDEVVVVSSGSIWPEQIDIAMFYGGTGRFIVVWGNTNEVTHHAYGRIYSDYGDPEGGAFRISQRALTLSSDYKRMPKVATGRGPAADGSYAVAYGLWPGDADTPIANGGYAVWCRLYRASGGWMNERQVNIHTANWQYQPDVAMAADGTFIITWQSFNQDPAEGRIYSIFVRPYNSDFSDWLGYYTGLPVLEVRMSTWNLDDGTDPAIAIDNNLNFAAAWHRTTDVYWRAGGLGPSAPIARPLGPYVMKWNDTIRFDGSGSTSDGVISSYSWTVVEGGVTEIATGSMPFVNYEVLRNSPYNLHNGVYTLTLTVISNGIPGSATTTLTLLNTDPTSDPGGPYSVNSGSSVTLNGTASYDIDNNPGPDGIETYFWYISEPGDINNILYMITPSTNTNPSPSVSYADLNNAGLSGNLNLVLVVTDADNGSDQASTTLTMVDNTLVSVVHLYYPTSSSGYSDDYYARASYGNVLLGTASREIFWVNQVPATPVGVYELNGSASSQDPPFAIQYYYFYVVMPGGVLLNLSSPWNTDSIIHVTYQQLYDLHFAEYGTSIPAGTYTVGLRVRNNNSPVNQAYSFTNLYVVNSIPIANVGGPYTVPYQGQVQLNGSGSYDPDFAPFGSYVGGVPTDGIQTYSWRIDDGAGPYDETTGTEIASGRNPTITWQNLETAGFADGNHTLFLWVYDGAAWSTAVNSITLSKSDGLGSFYFDDSNDEGLYRDDVMFPNMFTTWDSNNYVVAGWFKSGMDTPGDRGIFSIKERGTGRRDTVGINGTTLYWRTYDATGALLAEANCQWPLPFDGLTCTGATNAARGWHHFYCEVRKRASVFGPPSVGRWAWVMVDGQFGDKGWVGTTETLDHAYDRLSVGIEIQSPFSSAEGWLCEVCLWQLDDSGYPLGGGSPNTPSGYVGTPNVSAPLGYEPPWPDLGNPDTGSPAIPDNDEIDFIALASGTCPRSVRPDKIKAFWPLTITDDYADHWNDYDLICVVFGTQRCPSWTSCQNISDCPDVDPAPQPPIAVHNGSENNLPVYEVSRNGTVTFTAVGSYDPDGGDITEYFWYYYDGDTNFLGLERDVTVDHDTMIALTGGVGTFGPADGDGFQIPCIGLRVRDDDTPMEQDTAFTTIVVLPNNTPVAVANGPYYVYKNQRVKANGYVSGDPTGFSSDGTNDADWDFITVLWEIHDGSQWRTLSNIAYNPNNWSPATYLNIPNSQHDWNELVNTFGLSPDADYNVRLTIDDGIDSATDTTTLHIYANQAPVASAGLDRTLASGQTLNLNAGGSSDPDIGAFPSRPTGDPLTYQWEVYDSSGQNLIATLTGISAANETASFTFDELVVLGLTNGDWQIRVTTWDDGDNYVPYTSGAVGTRLSDFDFFVLTMSDSCPVADGGGPYIVSKDSGVALAKGSPFRFTMTAGMRGQHGRFGALCQSINTNLGGPGVFHITAGDEDNLVGENRQVIDINFGPTLPWYPVIGQAEATAVDIQWLEDEYNTGHGLRTPLKDSTNEDGPTGTVELMYSFDYGNALFVVLNEYWEGSSSEPIPPTSPADADVVVELRTWLEGVLQASNQPYKFVIGHEPAFPDPSQDYYGLSLDQYPTNRDAFWQILEDERVTAYISGHTGTYFHSLAAITDAHSPVHQLDVGNAGYSTGYVHPQTYFNITVDDDGVVVNVYGNGVSGASVYSLAESVDLAVGFDGRRSYDVDGDALTYRWEIDSIGNPLLLGTGSTLQKTYEEMVAYFGFGNYRITLLVTDGTCTDSYQTTITILAHYDYIPTPVEVDPGEGGDLYIEGGSAIAAITHYIYIPGTGSDDDLFLNGQAGYPYIYIPVHREVDPGEYGDLYLENGSAIAAIIHYIYIPGNTEDDPIGSTDDALHLNGATVYPIGFGYVPFDPGDRDYPCVDP